MKKLSLALLSITHLYAVDLAYISNATDEKTLDSLSKKYNQELLINENRVYLVPSDCRLNRYFGGASELKVQLAKMPEQTETIVITQEVFEAENEEVIKKSIEVKKSISIVEGKVSQEFLMDEEGRGYGGASELTLNYSFQKIQAVKVDMIPEVKEEPIVVVPKQETIEEKKSIVKTVKPYQHPTCRLLEDGSGYKLDNINNARFYKDSNFKTIKQNKISF